MRKFIVLLSLLLILSILACNLASQPTAPTPTADLKAPPTVNGATAPVTEPPGEPPTTTPGETVTVPPTLVPTALPTVPTPYPMCTPPACSGAEVYYCPGECPGGCGTQCATPTPKPVTGVPTIVSFTAEKTAIVQDEEVRVTWQATGGEKATLNWIGSGGLMGGVGDLNPTSGSVVIKPHLGPVVLSVTNAQGSTNAELALTIQCRYQWAAELAANPPGRCPGQLTDTWAAYQPFQNGFMIWMQSEASIYVFFNNYGGQSYRIYADSFKEGDPESDPSLTPPAGLQQPIRGFGAVWRNNPEVKDNLGWATAGETGFAGWLQSYQGMGMHNVTHYTRDPHGTLYKLSPMGQVWFTYP